MGCPETLVQIALSYAPSNYPEAQYLEGILPFDTEAYQLIAGKPYPDGFSSCAIFCLANYARAGFRAKGIGEPYQPFVGKAETLLVEFGRAQGALDANPDPNTFVPGDVVHIGTGMSSHWLTVIENPGDGRIISVDGGQPGISQRERTIVRSGGGWALSDGGSTRAVLHVIRAERLNVPCAPLMQGWTGPLVALLCAVGAGSFVRWLLT